MEENNTDRGIQTLTTFTKYRYDEDLCGMNHITQNLCDGWCSVRFTIPVVIIHHTHPR